MTKFNLDRDLCFFDLESTGLNILRDRIVQIAIIKYFADGREPEELYELVNPGIPISDEAMAVHGITAAAVANKPGFDILGPKILAFIGNSDLSGYNSNRFDIPMLMEEFARIGIDFEIDNRRLIDVQRVFYKMEPRTLKAAYRFYCQEELVDAHDALEDVRATVKVLQGQIAKYEGQDLVGEEGEIVPAPIRNDIQVLHDFTNDLRTPDATQKLRYEPDGTIVFNFGKYVGKTIGQVQEAEASYLQWILQKEFSTQLKQIIRKEL
ncbi:MAG: 3'-5' exonuclease, partial [Saprospiraceae bacterium]